MISTELSTPSLSIITATYNARACLSILIDSLANQTDKDFEWVVADGGSTDGTIELLRSTKSRLKNVIVDVRKDFGIYDALNRAINLSKGSYYIVLGADDQLHEEAVENFKRACVFSNAELITSFCLVNGGVVGPRGDNLEWLCGQTAFVTGHAVSLAIKKSLHARFGYYSNKFPIAADQLFIQQVIHAGCDVHKADFISGEFGIGGISAMDRIGCITEHYRVQLLVGKNIFVQTFVLILRLLINISRLRVTQ